MKHCDPWHSYLKEQRLQRGWTLTELCNLAEFRHLSKLSKIEDRTAVPSFVEAFRLAEIFNTYPETLFDPRTGLARTIREVEAVA